MCERNRLREDPTFYKGVKSSYACEFHTNAAQKTRHRQSGTGGTSKRQEGSCREHPHTILLCQTLNEALFEAQWQI